MTTKTPILEAYPHINLDHLTYAKGKEHGFYELGYPDNYSGLPATYLKGYEYGAEIARKLIQEYKMKRLVERKPMPAVDWNPPYPHDHAEHD